MKILSVHEGVVPINSSIRNAWIDFSAMDCSIVAIVSDVMSLFEAVSRLLQRVAATRPVVLLVDDVHLADPSSLDLSRSMAGFPMRDRAGVPGRARPAGERAPCWPPSAAPRGSSSCRCGRWIPQVSPRWP